MYNSLFIQLKIAEKMCNYLSLAISGKNLHKIASSLMDTAGKINV